jgi:uncharacterized membrane protein YfcA
VTIGLLMLLGGVGAGIFGSLLGLGGGILVVPLLTIAFGLPLREAVGVSLICVIVTSSASAGIYLERRVANLRLGMTLELFTAIGALAGGLVAFLISERILAGLFAALLVYVAVSMIRRSNAAPDPAVDSVGTAPPAARRPLGLPLDGPGYTVHSLGPGVAGSLFAGVVSALLGIGGGLIKVPVMHLLMGVPLRVAAATSNLMIGVTASASAIIYLIRGGIDPFVAGPTAIGVFIGATLGARAAHRIDLRILRVLFVAVLVWTAFEMMRRALAPT